MFQNYAMLTMLWNHLHSAKTKVIERSFGSTKKVFLKAHQINKTIRPAQARILEEWDALITSNLHTQVDLIIYLRIEPEIAMSRLKKRNRYEERNITINYIQMLNELYDQWLFNNPGSKFVTINADQSTEHMLKELNEKISQ